MLAGFVPWKSHETEKDRHGSGAGLVCVTLILVVPALRAASPDWRWSNPLPHGNNVYDLAWHDGRYWQVCDRGRIYTGTNRVTWTLVPGGTTRALRGIAFYRERVIVCGEAGTILHGSLAEGFKPAQVNPPTADWLEGVAASPSTLVAVGDNAAVYRSTDGGTNWQRVSGLAFTDWLRSVAWGGGNFVAVGENGLIATSADGQAWRRRSSPVSTALNRVVFRGGVFYAVGDNGALLASLNAGTNWLRESTGVTNALYAYAQPDALTATPRLVAGQSALLLKTNPLGGWTNQLGNDVLLPAPTWDYYAAVWDGARFLVGGRTGLMMESLETNVTLAGQTFRTTLWFEETDSPRDWLWEAQALPERYLAVGDRAQVLTSENGADWWSVPVPDTLTNAVFLGVAGDSNLVVAVGSAGALMFSPAGVTDVVVTNTRTTYADCAWTTNSIVTTNPVNLLGLRWTALDPPPTPNTLQGVATRSGRWVAVGDAGTVLTSTNGRDWQARTLPGQPVLSGAAAGTPGWVLTGSRGALFFSPDTGTWTPVTTGTTNWIYRVRWLGDRFVAVGQNGLLLTSPDGLAWTARPSGTSAWLTDALLAGDLFYVCGTQGTVLVSSNAADWTPVEVPTGKALYGLARRNSQLVAVGVEGVILRALLDPAAPITITSYAHTDCPDARVDRFRLRSAVDRQATLESSADLRTWQRVNNGLEFTYDEIEIEVVRTNLPPAPVEYFRLAPAAP